MKLAIKQVKQHIKTLNNKLAEIMDKYGEDCESFQRIALVRNQYAEVLYNLRAKYIKD